MENGYWWLVEDCLHCLFSGSAEDSSLKTDQVARMLGMLLVDMHLRDGASPELAETLAQAILDSVLVSLLQELPEEPGWLEAQCRLMAVQVRDNWDRNGKSEGFQARELLVRPQAEHDDIPGLSAVRVAFSFLSLRDQYLISLVLFERLAWAEVARQFEVDVPQARKEYEIARNRLSDLLEADREIPPELCRLFFEG